MSLASVILLINNNIIPNNNNEITADVLRPILIEMLQQPNDLIGVLGNLQTDDKSNLVNAINEIVEDLDSMSSVKVLSGDVDPNTIVQPDANPGDLYSQTDALGNPIKIWIYDGNSWQSIDVGNAVLFTPQTLTATQQQIARDNVEVYSTEQTSTLVNNAKVVMEISGDDLILVDGLGNTVSSIPMAEFTSTPKQKNIIVHNLSSADLELATITLYLDHVVDTVEFYDLHINGVYINDDDYMVDQHKIIIARSNIDYELMPGMKLTFRYRY